MNRTALHIRVRKLAHGVLQMDEETYRQVVFNIDPKSEGHITRCDDEHANLVLLALQRAADSQKQGGTSRTIPNAHQQAKIAKLGFILGWSWFDIAHFCQKQTGKLTTKGCDAKELTKVVNGMTNIINGRLADGSLKLPAPELAAFLKYTQQGKSVPKSEVVSNA